MNLFVFIINAFAKKVIISCKVLLNEDFFSWKPDFIVLESFIHLQIKLFSVFFP